MNSQSTRSNETAAATLDAELTHEASMLRHRATSLRQQAEQLDAVLALTYRRRASELELEAWLLDVQAGATEVGSDDAAHSTA